MKITDLKRVPFYGYPVGLKIPKKSIKMGPKRLP